MQKNQKQAGVFDFNNKKEDEDFQNQSKEQRIKDFTEIGREINQLKKNLNKFKSFVNARQRIQVHRHLERAVNKAMWVKSHIFI